MIFDCCHSGSGTRIDIDGRIRVFRGVDTKDVPPLTRNLDRNMLPAAAEISLSNRAQRGLLTHILLAACAPNQMAEDTQIGGCFTIALLNVWREQDVSNLTGKSCIQSLRLPAHVKCVFSSCSLAP